MHAQKTKSIYSFSTAVILSPYSIVVSCITKVKIFESDGFWFHPKIVFESSNVPPFSTPSLVFWWNCLYLVKLEEDYLTDGESHHECSFEKKQTKKLANEVFWKTKLHVLKIIFCQPTKPFSSKKFLWRPLKSNTLQKNFENISK